ncbi:glycosyltransferase family 2 protein [Danxiaibacter flavus]|uniref:Glycosyltransferase family 2 protein n=1 Tax=Danxiaibacter flavus TaxID=3049108 RepID=A0ABV3ZL55_9BACT|nr:glycosyltransferase family 2 protein [Chitinophagaceae bacterium DXS]
MKHCNLSVVVPLCKPKSSWHYDLLKNIRQVKMQLTGLNIQFIVVNDGFENKSLLYKFRELTESHSNISFISYAANMGKGYALRKGVASARGKYVIVTDFDFPYVHSNLADMYHLLLQGYDVVVGKRDKAYFKKLPLKRYIISKACNFLNRFLLRLPVADTQSGLKAFNHVGRSIFLNTTINRFLVDAEFVQLAYRFGLHIKPAPLTLRENIQFSNMNAGVIKTEIRNFLYLLFNRNRKLTTISDRKKYDINSTLHSRETETVE